MILKVHIYLHLLNVMFVLDNLYLALVLVQDCDGISLVLQAQQIS